MSSLILINDKNWGESEGYGKSPLTLSEGAHFANNSLIKRCLEDVFHMTEAERDWLCTNLHLSSTEPIIPFAIVEWLIASGSAFQ